MEWYLLFKEIVEILYMLSGVGLLVGLFFGYKQLRLMSQDYSTKNQRSSIEKSIEYLNLFATTFIPLISKYLEATSKEKNDLQKYKGPKDKNFKFDNNCNPRSEYIKNYIEASINLGAINILNQLEYFSAAMMSGVADEELAFTPLAETFCATVDEFYVTICYSRMKDGSNSFSYTISLYNHWKSRLEKTHLENHRNKIDEKISKIEPYSIPSLWKVN